MAGSQVRLLLLTAFVVACKGARMAQPSLTTSTQVPSSIAPITITLQEAQTPQAPICIDATSPTNPLGRLRMAMRNTAYTQKNAFFDAFLVFHSDEHLSEDPAPDERRLQYISGWDGTGTAVVLADGGAAIWVPSGDYNRARMTLSCAWLVLDMDDRSHPPIAEWIAERLGRARRVGGDARLTSVEDWKYLSTALQEHGLQLLHIPNLVDQLWNEEPDPSRRRPDFSKIVAKLHDFEYTGITWRDKITAVRDQLREMSVDAMIVTSLDEVAWLLNVRGRDVPYAPLLKAFVYISHQEVKVFAPPGKLSMPVREALAVYNCFTNNCTKVIDYVKIYTELRRSTETRILIPSAGSFQRGASAAIAQSVPTPKQLIDISPIIYLKAMKNEAEAKGMRRAHLRDAVAMCTLLSYIESKTGLDELSVTKVVDGTRETQASFVGASMRTRVAFSNHASDPDYRPTNGTNRRIFKNATLVIQSGGQYSEGTTEVTRTVHFGIPRREERTAYTTVLRSMAAMVMLSMPADLPAGHADPVARGPLWSAKQDYPHPTGHGVGAALNRKEDPVVIDYRQNTILHPFREGYFVAIEPAWYESNKFGVKLGNVLEVITKPNGYLGFKETTLIPYEPKLIDRSMLTEYEIVWLNNYNERIRKTVGPELNAQGLTDVFYWMMNKTIPIELPSKLRKAHAWSSSSTNIKDIKTTVISAAVMILFCNILL